MVELEELRPITYWDVWRLVVRLRLKAHMLRNGSVVYNLKLLDDPAYNMASEITPSSAISGSIKYFDRWYLDSKRSRRRDQKDQYVKLREKFVDATKWTHH